MNRVKRTSRMYAANYNRADHQIREQLLRERALKNVANARKIRQETEVVSMQREFLAQRSRKELKRMAKAKGQKTLFRTSSMLRRRLVK